MERQVKNAKVSKSKCAVVGILMTLNFTVTGNSIAADSCGDNKEARLVSIKKDIPFEASLKLSSGDPQTQKIELWDTQDTVALGAAALAVGLTGNGVILGERFSKDKAEHFLGNALVSAGLTMVTGKPSWGIFACILGSAARELWKNEHKGQSAEWMSMFYDGAGCAVGTWATTEFYLRPQGNGASAVLDMRF